MENDAQPGLTIPLADIADRRLAELARLTGASTIASLDGGGLLGERALLNGFRVPGLVSAGGGCRLMEARGGGWIALNLARPDDRELLPALFETALDPVDDATTIRAVARADATALLARGREMGLAIAALDEPASSPATETLVEFAPAAEPPPRIPLVVDLSALWAGPLAGHLLWLSGADVVKVESRTRPDTMRTGDPALFALLNQGKASVAIDLADSDDRRALVALLAHADVVIEAARPRALAQNGIDALASLRSRPGQAWITITGHGATPPHADWVGFGDDCAVAGGLSLALAHASGKSGFVGDAIADPLTAIVAALAAMRALRARQTCRIGLSMSGIVAAMLDEARTDDADSFDDRLRAWAAAQGQPFPPAPCRTPSAQVHALGADTARWMAPC